MFEYNNETLTLEELKEVAELKNVEFDNFYGEGVKDGSIVEKTEDVAEPGVAVASKTTAPDVSASSLEKALLDFPTLTDNPETVKKAEEAGLDVVLGARQEEDAIKGVTLPEVEIKPIEKQQEDLSKEIGEYNVKIEKATKLLALFIITK